MKCYKGTFTLYGKILLSFWITDQQALGICLAPSQCWGLCTFHHTWLLCGAVLAAQLFMLATASTSFTEPSVSMVFEVQ